MKCLNNRLRAVGKSLILGGGKVQLGIWGLVRPQWVQGRTLVGIQGGQNTVQLREFCRFSTLKTNFFLVPNCGGFEQSAASQQQSPEKHKLISHSKQEDKKPLRSYQFGSSVDNLVPGGGRLPYWVILGMCGQNG